MRHRCVSLRGGVDFTGALAGALSWLEDTRSTASLCFLVEGNTTEHFKKINRQKVQDSQARRSGHCHLDYWEKIFALLDTELPGRWFYMLEPLGGKGIFRCCYCGDTVSPHHARLLEVNRQVNHALSHVNHIQVSKLKSDVPDDPMLTASSRWTHHPYLTPQPSSFFLCNFPGSSIFFSLGSVWRTAGAPGGRGGHATLALWGAPAQSIQQQRK